MKLKINPEYLNRERDNIREATQAIEEQRKVLAFARLQLKQARQYAASVKIDQHLHAVIAAMPTPCEIWPTASGALIVATMTAPEYVQAEAILKDAIWHLQDVNKIDAMTKCYLWRPSMRNGQSFYIKVRG
jgi:hypothetical protein